MTPRWTDVGWRGSGRELAARQNAPGSDNDIAQRGTALVTALLAMLVLGAIGTMVSITVTEDVLVSVNHAEVTGCLYISEAGISYAVEKIRQSPAWTGIAWPGRTVGSGRFVVTVSDSSAAGAPLPPGEKRVNVRAIQGSTEREIEVLIQ